MFERYTEGARRTIFFARYEAGQYGSGSIEPEHLLLGLIREDKRLARRVFQRPGAAESIRKEIDAQVIHRDRISTSIEIPLSAESEQILRLASNSAEKLGHRDVDNVHLLLAILRTEECAAAQIVKRHCVAGDIIEQIVQNRTEREASKIMPAPGILMPPSVSIKLRLTIEKFLEAWRIRDAKTASNFFAPNGQLWNAHGELSLGPTIETAIRSHFSEWPEVESAQVKNILLLAEDVAAITLSWSAAKVSEQSAMGPFHLIIAMHEDAGGWHVASAHVANLKPA